MKIRNRDLISAADTLDRAAALIVEKGWGRGAFAYDEAGEEIDPRAEGACDFCVSGAIARVSGLDINHAKADGTYGPRNSAAADLLAHSLGVTKLRCGLADWNDETDQTADSVVKAMRDCAAMARTRWHGLSWWQRTFGTLN